MLLYACMLFFQHRDAAQDISVEIADPILFYIETSIIVLTNQRDLNI